MTSQSDELWTSAIAAANYTVPECEYRNAILEQYKVYVEMADRVSARRAIANTFFLTLNTAILTVVGLFIQVHPKAATGYLTFPLMAVLGECGTWYLLLRSYRQLNTAKYKVIGRLESRLPASPYWRGEWSDVGKGKDRTKYWPLTHVEQWVPILFGAIYLIGFAVAVSV